MEHRNRVSAIIRGVEQSPLAVALAGSSVDNKLAAGKLLSHCLEGYGRWGAVPLVVLVGETLLGFWLAAPAGGDRLPSELFSLGDFGQSSWGEHGRLHDDFWWDLVLILDQVIVGIILDELGTVLEPWRFFQCAIEVGKISENLLTFTCWVEDTFISFLDLLFFGVRSQLGEAWFSFRRTFSGFRVWRELIPNIHVALLLFDEVLEAYLHVNVFLQLFNLL